MVKKKDTETAETLPAKRSAGHVETVSAADVQGYVTSSVILHTPGLFEKGGPPGPAGALKIKSREELIDEVTDYFDRITTTIIDEETGAPIMSKWLTPPSFSGLALAIGLSPQTLRTYQQRDEYSDVVLQARAIIESYYEESLNNRNRATGAIFALKQLGWSDNIDLNLTTKGVVEVCHTPEEIAAMLQNNFSSHDNNKDDDK